MEIRRATTADEAQILQLLRTSLPGADDDRYAAFLEWKHQRSAFGASPTWVATTGTRIVGYRSFMRWEFESAEEPVVRAARAVDTVTDPGFRSKGIFSRLTLAALDDLAADGVAFIFNMPNDRSGPGYLKMGWKIVRHPSVYLRPTPRPRSLFRTLRARGASERWSLPSTAGVAAPEFLNQTGLESLLQHQPVPTVLRTRRTPEYLRWRYGLDSLAYRCLAAGDGPADGFVVFRIHRRGRATELVVSEVLVPGGDGALAGRLLRRLATSARCDHAITLSGPGVLRAGFIPVPGRGSTLMWRALGQTDPPAWTLTMGDLEIF